MKPAKSLLDGMPYTPAAKTDIRRLFRRVRAEQKAAKDAFEAKVTRIQQKRA